MPGVVVLPQSRQQAHDAVEDALSDLANRHPDMVSLANPEVRRKAADAVVRRLFADPAQAALFGDGAKSPSPACRVFLETVTQYARLVHDQKGRKLWIVDKERERTWFEEVIEHSPAFRLLDLAAGLQGWSTFLEAEYDRFRARQANRFPKLFKNSLLNWLRHEHAFHVPAAPRSDAATPCQRIREEAKKSALGRKESPAEFEQRVARMCERRGVHYVRPEVTHGHHD